MGLLDLDLVAEQTRETGHSTMGLITALREVLPERRAGVGVLRRDRAGPVGYLVRAGVPGHRGHRRAGRDAGCGTGRWSWPVSTGTRRCAGGPTGSPGCRSRSGSRRPCGPPSWTGTWSGCGRAGRRWEVVQLGGALGTMEFWGGRALDLLEGFAGQLGLGVPVVPWITARDGVAEFIWLLAAISATAGKIGNEVYQLQRPEIGELRESFTPGTVGSITMPHKRNPEISEHLVTLSRVIRAQAARGPGRDGVRARAGRPGLEGRVAGGPGDLDGVRGLRWVRGAGCWTGCGPTRSGCWPTSAATAATCCPSR